MQDQDRVMMSLAVRNELLHLEQEEAQGWPSGCWVSKRRELDGNKGNNVPEKNKLPGKEPIFLVKVSKVMETTVQR